MPAPEEISRVRRSGLPLFEWPF